MIEQLYMQYWIASATLAAANLGLADAVDSTPRHVDDIARSVGADASCLFRLMRVLASVGVFRLEGPRQFVSTPLSDELRSDRSPNLRAKVRVMGLKSFREAMTEYESAIRTGRSAFELVHGCGPFEMFRRRPEEAAIYHAGMALDGPLISRILERYDFGHIETLVDVGGGRGTLLARILQMNPRQRGVLFDLPEVIADSAMNAYGVESRCEARGGDLWSDIPVRGDGYILKNILHGWSDEACSALLKRIWRAGADNAHVLVIENVMPSDDELCPCKLFDLFLLLGGRGGRVRTESEFRGLFDESGFAMTGVFPLLEDQCVVEARRLQ